jgi:hypothetical protein
MSVHDLSQHGIDQLNRSVECILIAGHPGMKQTGYIACGIVRSARQLQLRYNILPVQRVSDASAAEPFQQI